MPWQYSIKSLTHEMRSLRDKINISHQFSQNRTYDLNFKYLQYFFLTLILGFK